LKLLQTRAGYEAFVSRKRYHEFLALGLNSGKINPHDCMNRRIRCHARLLAFEKSVIAIAL